MSNNKSRNNQSTSTVNNTYDTTVTTTDNRVAESGAAVGGNISLGPGDISGTVTLEQTDQGSILAARDIALESIAGISALAKSNQSVASDSISQAYGLANEARQSETSGAINNFLKYGAIIAVIAIVAYAYKKKSA